MKNKKIICLIEIFLMVSLSVAFSYIEGESLDLYDGSSEFVNWKDFYGRAVNKVLGGNIVSAFEVGESGAYTCLETKTGSRCQEFAVNSQESLEECNALCTSDCIPTGKENVGECRIGTCYDPLEGTCQAGSPKKYCEDFQGDWFEDPYENINECREGCCILRDGALFSTEQQCIRQSSLLGLDLDYRPEVNTELGCLALSNSAVEGACVFVSEDPGEKNDCRFETKSECLEQRGDFYPGYLCSNTELDTRCVPQENARCVEGKDELYWFDSCGNRENIYDSNEGRSWNEGKILSKSDSCEIGFGSDQLANQNSCGNCNYLVGSVCGASSGSERLSDRSIDFVCRDLRCVDKNGETRENGESWCEYQGAVGLDPTGVRSRDTPGSTHFRVSCLDGEIHQDPCADYRNEICVQENTDIGNGLEFSQAACRLNRWQQCMQYNSEYIKTIQEGGSSVLDWAIKERDQKCNENPDCATNVVDVGDFNFGLCTPKYPPGFNFDENPDVAENICSLGSQECKVIYVKKLVGPHKVEWVCEQNCECESALFAEEMHDLCMSLGDCGASVNNVGDYTSNYYISESFPLNGQYINYLIGLSNPIRGEYIKAGDANEFARSIGIPNTDILENPGEVLGSLGEIAGATGSALGIAANLLGVGEGVSVAAGAVSSAGSAGSGALIGEGAVFSAAPSTGGGFLATTTAFLGAAIGSALAVAAVAYLINVTGVGGGLPEAVTYALIGAAAVFGGITGAAVLSTGTLAGAFAGGAAAGPIGLIVVVIVIVVFAIVGIGDTKEINVVFSCQPWQAPVGGSDCDRCGDDGLPCTSYGCQSLGQTCELLNQGTSEEVCTSVAVGDVSAPIIKPLEDVLPENYRYSEIGTNGYRLESDVNEGCISSYEEALFGVELNEPGRCNLDVKHTARFEDMEFQLGNRNLFLYNHTHIFLAPNLESLGLPSYDPEKKEEYELYVRCEDKSGNRNEQEFVVSMCVKPGIDILPPVITKNEPSSEIVSYNKSVVGAKIYTNEPSACRWSLSDQEYETMENQMECETALVFRGIYGWECSTDLPIDSDENEFFVRCEDQPWLVESTETSGAYIDIDDRSGSRRIDVGEDRKRNRNQRSYVLNYRRTESALRIDSIEPNEETLVYGVEPASVEVTVETSGGVDGTALCEYSFGGPFISFFNTFSNRHSQVFQSFTSGNKKIEVRCKDSAGNVVEETAEFEVKIDNVAPEVTRIFDLGGTLYVVTDEVGECGFILEGEKEGNQCNFNLDESGVHLMDSSGTIHTSEFEEDKTHYIKCRDKFENYKGECNLIAQSGEI